MSNQSRIDYEPAAYTTTADRKAQRRHQRAQTTPFRRFLRVSGYVLGVTLVVLLAAAGAGLVALDRAYSGRIISNIAVQGTRLDYMQPDAARTALHQRYAAFLKTPVTLTFEGRDWAATPDQLGVTLDIDGAVEQAYGKGRGLNLFRSLLDGWQIWQTGVDLPLHVAVDQRQLQSYLDERARELAIAPENANVWVADGQVLSVQARIGRQMLVDETAQDVLAGLPALTSQRVAIRTRELHPLVENSGIAETQRQLTALLQSPVTLTAQEQRWTLLPKDIGAMVKLSREPRSDGQGQRISAALDRALLEKQLKLIADKYNVAPVEPRVNFNGGNLRITRTGSNGTRLEITQATDQLMTAMWQNERTLALPTTTLQPRARPDTLADLGIVELVAQGKSSFEKSAAYRVTNIQAGARQMSHVLIAPGEEFSFNQTVGEIDETNGFVQGYAIINNRTQEEWGGGVCQVATTVFRAAFWAGVPITERNQHSFRISWYEKFEPIGMDAAIFTGENGYDLRFVNDTDHWLLMEAYADTSSEVLTVNLYGTKPNREVIRTDAVISRVIPAPRQPKYVNDPTLPRGTVKQTDTARGGMDVRVGRIVKSGDKVLYKDTFFSRFKAWPNIFVRGTGHS